METTIYKHLLTTYGRRPAFWLALLCELVRTIIMRIYLVVIFAQMTVAVSSGDFEQAKHYIIYYLVASLVSALAGFAGDLIGYHTENVTYGELTGLYYKKLTNKDMSFYRDSQTGYLTAQFRQYLDSGLLLTRFLRIDGTRALVSLTLPAAVLAFNSVPLGLIGVSMIIVQLVYMRWVSTKSKQYREASSEIYRRISGEVADDITNIVAYKSAGQEKAALRHVMSLRPLEMEAFWNRRKYTSLYDMPRVLLATLLTAGAFWVAVDTVNTTPASIGLLVLTLTYMVQIMRTVGELPDLLYRYDDLISKLEPTLSTLTNEYETITDKTAAPVFEPNSSEVALDNISFRYQDEAKSPYIFKDFSLTINSSERIGVVGLSGAGKSTLASLLMRFDEVQSGEIRIDGTPINSVTQSSLRQKIAYVPQEPVLFHRSIKENIAYHNHTATKKDIIKAAKAAHAHEFIKLLPKGYDTIVGERGVKLSGGQKQRVVIARAILKNAPLILFDEATSALDSESEQIIQQALPEIIGKHTAIIIAHRLSTVAGLDRIIVMHGGRIEEQGTHQELLKNKSRYYSLWQKQTRNIIKS